MGRELHRAVWGRVGAAVIPLVVGRLFDHWLQTRTSAEPEKHRNKMFSPIYKLQVIVYLNFCIKKEEKHYKLQYLCHLVDFHVF